MKKILTLVLLFAAAFGFAQAHDFSVTLNGQKVYFNITSEKKKTVEVTYKDGIAQGQPSYYDGELTIPSKIRHNDRIYTVTGIGPKAFCGADRLTGIIIPNGVVSIGDFAFEGCTALTKIVFPGNRVTFGEGVFFKCDKIKDVTFGSDWKEINLKMFRWSDSLSYINIPAKMEKIMNLKSLKNLASVTVDVNNSRFSSIDGILYNKDSKTLYGCPRAYLGEVKVADSTRIITPGAFIDCKYITKIDMPAVLESMSFREFSRMPELQQIVFRGQAPVMTAVAGGKEVFLLQVMNTGVEILVPKKSEKTYREALVRETGEYSEIGGANPFYVEASKMPGVKNINGEKKL